jgi:hypothetical protein
MAVQQGSGSNFKFKPNPTITDVDEVVFKTEPSDDQDAMSTEPEGNADEDDTQPPVLPNHAITKTFPYKQPQDTAKGHPKTTGRKENFLSFGAMG